MKKVAAALVCMSAGALATLEVAQPANLAAEEMSLERDAQLLVCGSWPDKNLTITEADLDGIVARFSADTIPIKVEHVDSPLDPLGLVKAVRRVGNKLMGTLVFPPDIGGFLARRGIAKLSVGLERVPVALAEVSLVLKPRVASAAMLSEDAADFRYPTSAEDKAELVRLRQTVRKQTVDAQIAELKRTGRVVPAVEALARALLSVDSSALVTLSDGSTADVAATAHKLLQALPPLVKFAETMTGGGDQEMEASAPLTAEQSDWLKRSLGVDPVKVKAEMDKSVGQSSAGVGGPSYRTGGGDGRTLGTGAAAGEDKG